MNKKMDIKDGPLESEDIRIDYDHLEVSDIMDQIKKKIDARPKDELTGPVSDEKPPTEDLLNPSESEKSGPATSKTKRLLLKLMKPFSPIIKLLVLPVHQELRETIYTLDATNKRLDSLSHFLNGALDEVKKFNSETNKRVDLAFEDLARAKEYAKLLHNLSHLSFYQTCTH